MKTIKLKTITRCIGQMNKLAGSCNSKHCAFAEDDCKGTGEMPCTCGEDMRNCVKQLDRELKSVKL